MSAKEKTGELLSVLIVDTDAKLPESARKYLEHTGNFRVDIATSGHEALNTIHKRHYDGVIFEYGTPDMDVSTLYNRIRSEHGDLPCILFTKKSSEDVAIHAFPAIADYYLQKGDEPKAQFHELEKLIRRAAVEKRKDQEINRNNEKLMADIINFLPDPTFAVDVKGIVILWNNAMEDMTGIPAEEILGQNNYAYSMPFYHKSRPLLIDSVLCQDPNLLLPYENVRQNGSKIYAETYLPGLEREEETYVRITAAPFYDAKGKMCGAIETIRDVSGGKKAELLLKKSEERYRRLFTHMNEGSALHEIICDASGTPVDYRILEVNRTFETLLGLSQDQVVGKTSREAYQVEEAPYLDRYASVAFGGEPQNFETYFPAMKKHFKISVYSPENGFFVTIFDDITGRKQMEDHLAQLSKKLRLMTQIARHDIINKVTGILLSVEYLRLEYSDQKLGEILTGIANAAEEINDELAFTRTYEEIGSNEPIWQRLQDVVTCDGVPGQITFTCDVVGIEVFADAMLKRVFSNLLDNAIRHGKDVTEIHVSHRVTPDGLTIIWEDNGRGVPLIMKKKIFERGVGENTGLGLFLVREILAITGITIQETGSEGTGARFEIVVPADGYRME